MEARIKQIKVLSDGLQIKYDAKREYESGSVYWIENTTKSPVSVDQSLSKKIQQLKVHLIRNLFIMGLGKVHSEIKDFTTNEQKIFKEVSDRIDVTEIIADHGEDISKVQVKGTMLTLLDKEVKLDTGKIDLSVDGYGEYAFRLGDSVRAIHLLTQEYLDKVGMVQLEINFEQA